MSDNPSLRNIKDCHGCCHEAVSLCKKENKHFPSGEKACMGCIRNPFPFRKFIFKDNYMTSKDFNIFYKSTFCKGRKIIRGGR